MSDHFPNYTDNDAIRLELETAGIEVIYTGISVIGGFRMWTFQRQWYMKSMEMWFESLWLSIAS